MLIRKKLPIITLLIVFCSLLLMNTIYNVYISNTLIRQSKENIDQVLVLERASLEIFFKTREIEVTYLAKNTLVHTTIIDYLEDPLSSRPDFKKNYLDLNAFFTQLKAERQDLRDVFILTPKGQVLASSHPDSLWIDLSDRDYFLDAMVGKTTISSLLVDRVDGESVLFVATPIYNTNNRQILGVMCNIIDTNEASERLRSLVDPSVGEAYLIDEDGMIVFHTDRTRIGSRHTNTTIDSYFKDSATSSSGSEIFTQHSDSYYIAYDAIANTPWKLVVEQNMDALRAPADRALGVMLLISLFTLLLAGRFSFKFAKNITNPITELGDIMHKTTGGDLSVRSTYISGDELGHLSNDLNHMLDELVGAYEEVASKNDELTATEEELRNNYQALKKSQASLRAIQNKYTLALQGSSDVVWEWSHAENRFFASEVWFKLTGISDSPETINMVPFESLLQEDELAKVMVHFEKHLNSHTELITFDFIYQHPDGKKRVFNVKGTTFWNTTGKPTKTSGVLADVTYERESEKRMHDLAFISQLTKLPTRLAYLNSMEELIDKCKDGMLGFTVMQMDVDNFMRINHSLGHNVGNDVLHALAQRLKTMESDALTVYHLSADEFGLIVKETRDEMALKPIIDEVFKLLNAPVQIGDRMIYISMSMGVASYPDDGITSNKLLQNAATALSSAKRAGKSNYVYYTKIMSDAAHRKVELESLLRRAVEDQLISMHYQPQYSVQDKTLIAYEALMRITTEEGVRIPPDEFIPVAEESNLILALGEWALRDVVKTVKSWLDKGYPFQHVSVNVSGIQLQQKAFPEMVQSVALEAGIEPRFIELEITESVLIGEYQSSENPVLQLKNMGFKVALDDFGTGYSSFSYLRTMPLTTLKIDKSFIDHLADSKKDRELVRQMIDMGHDMALVVIAEGVETQEQYDILKETNCDYIQGYYFNKPLSLDQAVKIF